MSEDERSASVGVPSGSEGLDRALDLEEDDWTPRHKSGGEASNPEPSEPKLKRSLMVQAKRLGTACGALAIIVGTAVNTVNSHLASKRQAEAEKAAYTTKTDVDEVEAKAKSAESASDEGYKLLARTVNVHTDQLERLEDVIDDLEGLAAYIDWKHEQDVRRYGQARLERMMRAFEDRATPDVDEEELIARLVTELAARQAAKNGGPVELPKKLSHIPTEPEFFK